MLGISPHIWSCGYSWGNICIAFWGLCICLCVNGSVFFVGFYRHWIWSLSRLDSHDWFMLLILDWGDPDNFWQCLKNNFIFTFLSSSQNNQHFFSLLSLLCKFEYFGFCVCVSFQLTENQIAGQNPINLASVWLHKRHCGERSHFLRKQHVCSISL